MRLEKNSLNGGELSDWLDSRSDLYKSASGCRTLENCHVIRYGGARRRAGFVLAGKARAAVVRLEGVNFSRQTGYVLEFSAGFLRVWNRDGTPVETSPGTAYEIATPYAEKDLFELDFAQKNDVIVISHRAHPTQILKHFAADNWTIDAISYTRRPWSDFNDTDTTVTITQPASTLIATFSESILDSSWEGSFLRVSHPLESNFQVTSFGAIFFPPGLSSAFWTVEFNPNSNYDPDPSTAGNRSRVFYRNGFDTNHHTFWRCISSHTGAAGSNDPADYPNSFAQGIIALGPVLVTGNWEFETTGRWTGTWKVERSYDNGATWSEVATAFSIEDANILVSESEVPERPALFRVLAWSSNTGHSDSAYFRVLDGDVISEFEIVTVNSGTEAELSDSVTGKNGDFLILGESTKTWSDDAFSEKNGYPSTCTFHESRLFFAATDTEPERLWASKTDSFFDFNFGTEAADAFNFVLNANRYNEIVWLCSQQALLIGTTGAEWSSFTTEGGPMTPENTNFHLHTHHGSDRHPGLVLSDAPVFVQRQGRKIREFSPAPQGLGLYASPDLTELAEHITRGGIKQMAKRDSPDTELFALRNDGQLATMIFERSQQIYAWSRWTTSGTFLSVATTYGDGEDDAVFVAVSRTFNGVTQTFIEYLSPDGIRAEENNDPTKFVSVDHAQRITALGSDYANETLSAHDGFTDLGDFTANGSGTITLPGGEANPVIGLNFTTDIEPTPFEVAGHANKVSHQSAHVRLRNSSNFKIGTSERTRFNAIAISSAPASLDKVISIPGKFDRNSSVVIQKDRPGPFSLISIDLQTDAGTL